METQAMLDYDYDSNNEDDDNNNNNENENKNKEIKAYLIRYRNGEIIKYELYKGANLIGSDNKCSVQIEHNSISSKHALIDIICDNNDNSIIATIIDIQSKNFTMIQNIDSSSSSTTSTSTSWNRVLLDKCNLYNGSKIRFGKNDN